MTQSAFFRFLTYRLEHHVYLSIFGLILVRTYNNITIYTPECRRASMGSSHKQFFTPVYISISCHILSFFKFCNIFVSMFLSNLCKFILHSSVHFHLSNLCKFSPDVQCLFTLFIFLLAIVIAFFVIIAFARILCSRAIYVFLRVSYFVFIFSLSSVVYLYPSEMFKDLSARFSKIFQCIFSRDVPRKRM